MARMMWLAWLSCLHGAPNLRSDARGIRCFMVSQACTILLGRNRGKLLLILARKASETRRITYVCTQKYMPDESYQWVEDANEFFTVILNQLRYSPITSAQLAVNLSQMLSIHASCSGFISTERRHVTVSTAITDSDSDTGSN